MSCREREAARLARRRAARDRKLRLARRELDAKGVFQSITDGREKSGLRMPAWRGVLSDEEIWKVTAYVLSISQHPK
jgi:mono/diheme cytochrome c family protein